MHIFPVISIQTYVARTPRFCKSRVPAHNTTAPAPSQEPKKNSHAASNRHMPDNNSPTAA